MLFDFWTVQPKTGHFRCRRGWLAVAMGEDLPFFAAKPYYIAILQTCNVTKHPCNVMNQTCNVALLVSEMDRRVPT